MKSLYETHACWIYDSQIKCRCNIQSKNLDDYGWVEEDVPENILDQWLWPIRVIVSILFLVMVLYVSYDTSTLRKTKKTLTHHYDEYGNLNKNCHLTFGLQKSVEPFPQRTTKCSDPQRPFLSMFPGQAPPLLFARSCSSWFWLFPEITGNRT